MKPEKSETGKVNIIVCRDLEKVMCHGIKIFRITFNKSQLNKIEIEEMEYQEDKN